MKPHIPLAEEIAEIGLRRLAAIVESSNDATFACLRVWDDGRGIRPEFLPRIFEPFLTTKLIEGVNFLAKPFEVCKLAHDLRANLDRPANQRF